MPYAVQPHGSRFRVVNTDTGKVHARSTTKAKAEAQKRVLEDAERSKPVKVKRLSDGTRVRVFFKGKRGKRHGKAQ